MDSAVALLPQPLSPTRQKVSPAAMEKETPSTARNRRPPEAKSICKWAMFNKLISFTKSGPLLVEKRANEEVNAQRDRVNRIAADQAPADQRTIAHVVRKSGSAGSFLPGGL